MSEVFDEVILGGGFFGLYHARTRLRQGLRVALIEADPHFFSRASMINQARIHLGYHYPRSLGTALQALEYFDKFVSEFHTAVNAHFQKIYAISTRTSYTSARQFEHFSNHLGIRAERIAPEKYFQKGAVEACFVTAEPSFDAPTILQILRAEIENHPGFSMYLNDRVVRVEKSTDRFDLQLQSSAHLQTASVINATYSSINANLELFGFWPLPLKYELAEVALGAVSADFKNLGITVMDGPFFSLMPFGHSGLHSLTAVEYTPHRTSQDPLPTFACQNSQNLCTPRALKNCDTCPDQPDSSFPYMYQLARRFLREDFSYQHQSSRFAIKTILRQTEVDDSRPTLIQVASENPRFASVLSGKINTVYEMERLSL